MYKFSLTLCAILVTASSAMAQFSVTFRNGVTPLPGGGLYDGAEDAEFRSQEPGLVDPQGENPEISVDGDDGGNVTQAAIRFTNLLVSEGGSIPDQVSTGAFTISRAVMSLWKLSPSEGPTANITFTRVIGADTTAGRPWQHDDAWAELVDVFVPDPSGAVQEFPFRGSFVDGVFKGDGVEVAVDHDFDDDQNGDDSEDRLNDFRNSVEAGVVAPFQAFQSSFYDFDVTDAVVDWLVRGEPNYGWVINNNTGDGWDIAASEMEGLLDDQSFLDGETVLPGVDLSQTAPLPLGLAYGAEPGSLVIDGIGIRPSLTIFYDGPGGAADLNFDGVADAADVAIFLANYGAEIDGPLTLGSPGDLDFDRDVDAADFVIFRQAFESSAGAPLASFIRSVPEPTGIAAWSFLGMLGLALRRRARNLALISFPAAFAATGAMAVADEDLTVVIDSRTGSAALRNDTDLDIEINAYLFKGINETFDASGWQSLTDQATPGWLQGQATDRLLSETNILGGMTIPARGSIGLGEPYQVFQPNAIGDVENMFDFTFSVVGGPVSRGDVEFVADNNVVLVVNTSNGAARLVNQSTFNVSIDSYLVQSPTGVLDRSTWDPLAGSVGGWTASAGTPTRLAEVNVLGAAFLAANGGSLDIGNPVDPSLLDDELDLVFQYSIVAGQQNVARGILGGVLFEAAAAGIMGDLNGDGSVDGADLGILFGFWGSSGGVADLNNDQIVDGADVGTLFSNWTGDGGPAATVPEPSAWMGFLCSAVAVPLWRKRVRSAALVGNE